MANYKPKTCPRCNIDFAHRACNTRKRDKTLEEYREWQAKLRQAS